MPSLSSDILQDIQEAQRVLLSPLAYGTREAWYEATAHRVQRLMGCDCVFIIRGNSPAQTSMLSPHLDPDFARDTEAFMRSSDANDGLPLPARLQVRRIQRGSGVHHELDLTDRADIETSPYYQDVARPHGLGYATGMNVVSEDKAEVTFCTIFQDKDAPGYAVEAGQRLAPLVPALEAGLHHRAHLGRLQQQLRTLIDTLQEAVAIFTMDGREVHRNTACVDLLRYEPERETLIQATRRLVVSKTACRVHAEDGPMPAQRTVHLASGAYTVRATHARRLLDALPTVLVTVTRKAALPTARALQLKWDLTTREAEVALHVARGATNSEVAAALAISPHTARHHVSSVLYKLNVDSRKQVAAVLVGPH